jgi:oligopeptide/dipeptide ABC transporter ATP-binding protein
MGVIMITHDLGVIAEISDHVAVMYAGKVAEEAPVGEIFANPQHPYTQGLLRSMPSAGKRGHRLEAIKGVVPHPLNLPPGCSFAPRCPQRFEDGTCDRAFPALDATGPQHSVACYLFTRRQDEVRSTKPLVVDPNSPEAEEVVGA